MKPILPILIENAETLKISKARAFQLISNAEILFTHHNHRVIEKLDDLDAYIGWNSLVQSVVGLIQSSTASPMGKPPNKATGI